ncbi:MAG: type III-B CRISPR module RAMP protein Cmr4 [Eubacterium sp.]
MIANLYKIECLTNMHVGSGEVNYNIVDNEVEKDPVSNRPVIYASSLKGALRSYCEERVDQFSNQRVDLDYIFGSSRMASKENEEKTEKGNYKFLEAQIMERPLRTSKGNASSISVTSIDAVKQFYSRLKNFGFETKVEENELSKYLEALTFSGEKVFFVTENIKHCEIEGYKTEVLGQDDHCLNFLKQYLGDSFAITTDQILRTFDLPVMARNQLNNGISQNLWYEEVVPYTSTFYFIILRPDGTNDALSFEDLVQIGGNASVGYGFTKIKKVL